LSDFCLFFVLRKHFESVDYWLIVLLLPSLGPLFINLSLNKYISYFCPWISVSGGKNCPLKQICESPTLPCELYGGREMFTVTFDLIHVDLFDCLWTYRWNGLEIFRASPRSSGRRAGGTLCCMYPSDCSLLWQPSSLRREKKSDGYVHRYKQVETTETVQFQLEGYTISTFHWTLP